MVLKKNAMKLDLQLVKIELTISTIFSKKKISKKNKKNRTNQCIISVRLKAFFVVLFNNFS